MTHNEIYTKFMIEYDKANVTSSYPSLTKYEVATILNKAYLALIGQKFTGNNVRRAAFEVDEKAIADLSPLEIRQSVQFDTIDVPAANIMKCNLPQDPKMLYFVECLLKDSVIDTSDEQHPSAKYGELLPTKLVNHDIAQKFYWTSFNTPWIKMPVVYIEDNILYAVYDPDHKPLAEGSVLYIKQPSSFTQEFNGVFECNDAMAEELISLAVAFALENVESQRLNTKLNMRGLES